MVEQNDLFEFDIKKIEQHIENIEDDILRNNYIAQLIKILKDIRSDMKSYSYHLFPDLYSNPYIKYFSSLMLENKFAYDKGNKFEYEVMDLLSGITKHILEKLKSLQEFYKINIKDYKDNYIRKIHLKIDWADISRIFHAMYKCKMISEKTQVKQIANIFQVDAKAFSNNYSRIKPEIYENFRDSENQDLFKEFILHLIEHNVKVENIKELQSKIDNILIEKGKRKP